MRSASSGKQFRLHVEVERWTLTALGVEASWLSIIHKKKGWRKVEKLLKSKSYWV